MANVAIPLGLTAAGITTIFALYLSGAHQYIQPLVTRFAGTEGVRMAVATNNRCNEVSECCEHSKQYQDCLKTLEHQVTDLVNSEEIDLGKCKLHDDETAQCEVSAWFKTYRVKVTEYVLVNYIKRRDAVQEKYKMKKTTAKINGVPKEVLMAIHTHDGDLEKEEENSPK